VRGGSQAANAFFVEQKIAKSQVHSFHQRKLYTLDDMTGNLVSFFESEMA
jgi:hypothetical protein